jgi:hypothetical protein
MAISVNTATDALRITQTGAGNALVVEDSANPDATPFVVTADGNVGIGTTAPQAVLDLGSGSSGRALTWSATASTRYASIFTAFSAADIVLGYGFHGSSSADSYLSSWTGTLANAGVRVGSGTVQFFTNTATAQTAGNAFTPTERMRLTSAGNLGIGTTAPAFALGSGLEIERAGIATLRLENSAGSNSFEIASDSTTNGVRFLGLNNAPFVFSPNNNERMRLTSAGELLVGGTVSIDTTPIFGADVDNLSVQGSFGGHITLFRNDTSVISGNGLGSIVFYGNDTTSNTPTALAYLNAVASGDHAAGDNPTDITFGTTPDGTGTVAEAGRITQAGSYVLKGGTTTAAAGVGIIFPATQVASANANSLDDYEEGTWTVAFPSGTGTFTSQIARYTKIGRQVFAEWDFTVNTIGTSSASQFSGLPFTQGGSISGGTIAFWSSAANGIIGVGGCYASTTLIYLTGSTTSQTTATDWNAMGNGTRITGAITYTV